MTHRCSITFLSSLLFLTASAQDSNMPLSKTDIYRHYVGTIGGMPVELDLGFGCCLSNFGGSNYYYPNSLESYVLMVYDQQGDNNYFRGRADPSSGNGKRAEWKFHLEDDKLTGKCIGYDGDIQAIDMAEDYTNSYFFSVIRIKDTVSRMLENGVRCRAEAFYVLPAVEAGADASYINNQIIRFAGGSRQETDVLEFAKAEAKEYINKFLRLPSPKRNSFFADVTAFTDYSKSIIVYPVYNRDGLLVLRKFSMGFTGGESELSGDFYICIDVRNRRIWTANDIIKRNVHLSPLLEQKLKKMLSVPETDNLSAHILTETVPATDNIMVSGNNLKFCYNRGELLKDKYNEADISLSYKELDGLLTEEFKTRMGL